MTELGAGVSVCRNLEELLVLCVRWLQSCPILCDPMDRSPAGSSVCGILQARTLEWVSMPSSRGSSQPRVWTRISYVFCIGRRVLYHWHLLEDRHGCHRLLAEVSKSEEGVFLPLRFLNALRREWLKPGASPAALSARSDLALQWCLSTSVTAGPTFSPSGPFKHLEAGFQR